MPRIHYILLLLMTLCLARCVKKTPAAKLSHILNISAGYYDSCAVQYHGILACWGNTLTGTGGFNSLDVCTVQSIPVLCAKRPGAISDLGNGVLMASVGAAHSCANVGGVGYCWGDDTFGELGDGGNTLSYSALQVSGFTANVTSVAAGYAHSCGVMATGAYCWGDNTLGELGDGTNNDSNVPVAVVGLGAGVVKVTSGSGTSCALLATGAVVCWGANTTGQLGDGTMVASSNVPVVAIAANATDVALGTTDTPAHSCAIVNGGLKCWGLNIYGQLGDGTVINRNTPTDVVGLTSGVTAVAVGGNHTCALVNGGVKCWGLNSTGQLGAGSGDLCIGASGVVSCSKSPLSVNSLDRNVNYSSPTVIGVSAGNEHSCALLEAQTMMCWGDNSAGQLGNHSIVPTIVPVAVLE